MNPATTKPFLTRKEIAGLTGLTTVQIANNEKRLGLIPCKRTLNLRYVDYESSAALEALEEHGFLRE